MSKPSYYEVLGIDAEADLPTIKAAYRKLAFELHPDRNDNEAAAEQFFLVKNAYEALTDPIRRAAYDDLRRAKVTPTTRPPASPPQNPGPRQSEEPPPRPKAPSRASPDDLVKLTGLLTRGRFAEAERMARKMIGQRVNHPIPYAVLGDIAKMRGDLTYAAEMYAYAVQLDKLNLIYQRKHDEVVARIAQGGRRISTIQPEQDDNSSLLVTSLAVLIGCIAVVLGTEPPMASEMPMIGTWTWTLVVALAGCGLVLGICLSLGGLISRFSSLLGGFGENSLSPGVLVAAVSILNLWLGAILHSFLGVSHRQFDMTATRMLGGSTLITLLLSGASAAQGKIDYLQTFLWGGNIVYACALLGWLAGDAYLEESGRLK